MTSSEIKVFEPDWISQTWLILFEVFVILIFYAVLGSKWAVGSGFISVSIFIGVVLFCILIFRLRMSETLSVSPYEVVQRYFLSKRRISLGAIRGVRVEDKKKADAWIFFLVNVLFAVIGGSGGVLSLSDFRLLIKTNNAEIVLGHGFRYSQLNKAADYILEQIRIYCPENYAVIQREEQKKQEEKTKKERKAITEFKGK